MAPRILIFSITIAADYSYKVTNSEIWVPAFFKHNNCDYSTTEVMLIGTLTTEPAKDSNLMMPTPKNPFLKQYWTSAKMVLYQMRDMIPRIPRIPKIPKIPIQIENGQTPHTD